MVSSSVMAGRSRPGLPAGMWFLLALGLPFVGAVTVTGIYLNKEVVVAAAWVAFAVAGTILFDPLVGVIAMAGGFLLAAYPTVLQDLGVLTINNLLGLVLAVALVAYVLSSRDLSFLRVRQVLVLAWAAQRVGRVGGQHALPAQKTAPGANGGHAAGDGRFRVPLIMQPGEVGA